MKQKHICIYTTPDVLEHKNYSDQTALVIDQEVQKIVSACYKQAKNELNEHKTELKKLADALLEKEVLNANEVREITGLEKAHREGEQSAK